MSLYDEIKDTFEILLNSGESIENIKEYLLKTIDIVINDIKECD